MVKTTLTPQNTNINVLIPKTYIGKKVEVLVYPIDEIDNETIVEKTMSAYKGILSKATVAALQIEIENSRKEWE